MKFKDLAMSEDILRALNRMGFEEMTPIQEKTYPLIKEGRDICGLAQTGSGKTAACAIPLVEKIDVNKTTVQALVVVPTRELCIQYVDEIGKIAGESGVKPFGIYGEFSKDIQAAKIKDTVHILVATPGRLIDLMYDGIVSLSDIMCVILDEADELLKEGFQEDVDFILSCIRQEHQTLLFSATMADPIKELVSKYLNNPEMVTLIAAEAAPKSLKHVFMMTDPHKREEHLIRYLKEENIGQAIIFCNTRSQVDKLHGILNKKLGDTEYIHAGLSQDKRSSIFRRFKNKKIRFMIASDVAGRGLDFSKVTHVINWDFPREREQYTHRTGRAGRMGREGIALTFISKRDLHKLKLLINDKQIIPYWIGYDPLGGPADSALSSGGEKRTRSAQSSNRSRNNSPKKTAGKSQNKNNNTGSANNKSNYNKKPSEAGNSGGSQSQDNRKKSASGRNNNGNYKKGEGNSRTRSNNFDRSGNDRSKKNSHSDRTVSKGNKENGQQRTNAGNGRDKVYSGKSNNRKNYNKQNSKANSSKNRVNNGNVTKKVRYRGTTPIETIEVTKIPVKKQRVPLGTRIRRLFGKED